MYIVIDAPITSEQTRIASIYSGSREDDLSLLKVNTRVLKEAVELNIARDVNDTERSRFVLALIQLDMRPGFLDA